MVDGGPQDLNPSSGAGEEVVLTVNTGSSSVRLGLYTMSHPPRCLAQSRHELSSSVPSQTLQRFLNEQGPPAGVAAAAHRLVHGGEQLKAPSRVDAEREAELSQLAPLAPLHNPKALTWIHACRKALGERTPQVVVPETAYYAGLPQVATDYALAREPREDHGIRRYGFHGLAHTAMARHWRGRHPEFGNARVISLQLGAGCSITATYRERPQDTSMGFSPLEGLVMATRCGDLDPAAILHWQEAEGLSPSQIERRLNEDSGLLGLSGVSADMRELLASKSPQAERAIELYCYRARKYIGAYLAVLGGADALVFGGGVGENAPEVRERILSGMEWCGIQLEPRTNRVTRGQGGVISALSSPIEVEVIAVDEARVLAEEAIKILAGRAHEKGDDLLSP